MVKTAEGEKKAMFGGLYKSTDRGGRFAAIPQPDAFKRQADGMIAWPPAWPVDAEK